MHTCPNCGEPGTLYYANTWCAGCGWHRQGTTVQHADFAPDLDGCKWCAGPDEQ